MTNRVLNEMLSMDSQTKYNGIEMSSVDTCWTIMEKKVSSIWLSIALSRKHFQFLAETNNKEEDRVISRIIRNFLSAG